MRLSLPVRIVLVHLVFTLGAAAVAAVLVRHSFRSYRDQWEREVATLPAQALFTDTARELARSMLLRQESPYPEVRELNQQLTARV